MNHALTITDMGIQTHLSVRVYYCRGSEGFFFARDQAQVSRTVLRRPEGNGMGEKAGINAQPPRLLKAEVSPVFPSAQGRAAHGKGAAQGRNRHQMTMPTIYYYYTKQHNSATVAAPSFTTVQHRDEKRVAV